MKIRILVFGTALLLTASLALAQAPGLGGQRGGQRGGIMGGGGPRILLRPEVQKELSLTSSQTTKIQEALQSQRGAGGFGRGGGGGGRGDMEARREAMQEAAAKLDKAIKDILNESQYKRYQELSLQQQGPSALNRPEIAKKLGLSESQKQKIQEINSDQMEQMRSMFQGGGGGGDFAARREEMQKLREQTSKKLLAVLTSAQKKKWDDLLGKPFKFEQRGG